MVVYSTRRRGGRGLAYILYVRVREQVHLTQCRDFLVSEARATSKLWNWLFKHHTTPFWATCIYILARTLTCDASICGPTRPSLMHACMHHFDLHRERLINFTIDEDSFGLHILRQEHIVCGEEGVRGPSYVVRLIWTSLCVGAWFTVFEACGTSKLCILGIQHIYIWLTCKAVVVLLSHPLKRLSAISMLSICGPAWSITTFCLTII